MSSILAVVSVGWRLSAHLVDRRPRSLVHLAAAVVDGGPLLLGLLFRFRSGLLRARLGELLLQLLGRVGLHRPGLRLAVAAKEPGEHRRQPYPRQKPAHRSAMLLFRGLLASSRADPFPVALAREADSDQGKEPRGNCERLRNSADARSGVPGRAPRRDHRPDA